MGAPDLSCLSFSERTFWSNSGICGDAKVSFEKELGVAICLHKGVYDVFLPMKHTPLMIILCVSSRCAIKSIAHRELARDFTQCKW